MTTLTVQTSSLQAICRKEDRAKQACLQAGIRVDYPDNAKGHKVTYSQGNNRLAFKQNGGQWVEVNEVASGHFSSDMMALIVTHARFYARLVEA